MLSEYKIKREKVINPKTINSDVDSIIIPSIIDRVFAGGDIFRGNGAEMLTHILVVERSEKLNFGYYDLHFSRRQLLRSDHMFGRKSGENRIK